MSSSLWVDVMNESRVGRYMDRVERAMIARHLPSTPQSVLDIGGGTGRWSLWLAELGHAPTLLELERYNLNGFKRHAPHLNAVQADALANPFPDAAYDAVIAVQVFGLLPDHAQFVAELARVLKKGGLLFISWTNRQSIKGLLYNRYSDMKGTPEQERFQLYGASHAENLALLKGSGFEVSEAIGYQWPLLPRAHNSPLLDLMVSLESGLGLNRLLSISPNIMLTARKV